MIIVRVAGLLASAIVILGSFLPWAIAADGGGVIYGMERGGILPLVVGIVMAVLFALARRGTLITAAVLSPVALVIGVAELIDLMPVLGEVGARPGIGIVMIIAGGLCGVAGASLAAVVASLPRPPATRPVPWG